MTPEDLARRLRDGDAPAEIQRQAAACIEALLTEAPTLGAAMSKILDDAVSLDRDALEQELDGVCDDLATGDAGWDRKVDAIVDGVRWGVAAARAGETGTTTVRILTPDGVVISHEWRGALDREEDRTEILRSVAQAMRGRPGGEGAR